MKLALIGDPVEHSRSPQIHRAFMREANIDGSYVALRVPIGNVISVVRRMRLDEYVGANVTSPLKEEVMAACDSLTDEARRVGAVNTLFFGPAILGHNTDGIGARVALEATLDDSIALKRIGVLGYGATARAILSQFQENDAYTFVWGRELLRVADVCERYDAKPWPLDEPPKIIISTLPPGVGLPPDILSAALACDVVMDVNYGERSTLQSQLDRAVVHGDAMLAAQAHASFDFWLAHMEGVAPE